MTLWRVELLRLVRTGRLWIVMGVYALFGVLGPLSARYLPEIIERFGGGVEVTVAETTPVDAMGQFFSNAGQLGLLAVLAVAAGALTFDARPEWAAFLRTRARSMAHLVLPRVVMPTLAGVAALATGTAIAAALTAVMIGGLSVTDLVLGTLFGGLYLAFVVSVVALAASVTSQAVTTVLLSVGVLVLLPILQVVSAIEPWLPSRLLGATTALLAGVPAAELLKATVVTIVVTAALLVVAIRRLDAREQ